MHAEEIVTDVDVKPQMVASGEDCITYTRRKRERSARTRPNGGEIIVRASDEVEETGIGNDIDVKPEIVSFGEGCIAYSHQKKARSHRPRSHGDSASILTSNEVLCMTSGEGKIKDIGWEHGETILPGNRFSWKCRWCGLVRSSGGVTRLKKHLAGVRHIKPCPKVPEDVARAMRDNLLEMGRKQLKKQKEKHNDVARMPPDLLSLDLYVEKESGETDVDVQVRSATQRSNRTARSKFASEMFRDSNRQPAFGSQRYKKNTSKVTIDSQQFGGSTKRSRSSTRRSRFSYKRSSFGFHQLKDAFSKDTKGTHDTYAKAGHAKKDHHWRSILENMLYLPGAREGGCIRTCVIDALTSGPSHNSRTIEMVDITKDNADPEDNSRCHLNEQSQYPLDESETEPYNQKSLISNTLKCQQIFLHLLRSEKFVSVCDLLGKNFQDVSVEKLFDFSQINLKMNNGVYEQSPGLFNQDVKQVWRKFQRICQELVLSVSGLSNISDELYRKVVGADVVHEEMTHEAVEPQSEENNQLRAERKNSNDLGITAQTEASFLYKVCTCKQCDSEVDRDCTLICNECEAAYHFSCAKPPIEETSTRSWYCSSCIIDKNNNVHDCCGVCDKLKSIAKRDQVNNNCRAIVASVSQACSISSTDSDDTPEPSMTTLSRLCKHCKTPEDKDMKFLICGHSQCPYKFYHIRCLKSSQIASLQQQNRRCWYCPSCLCRTCFVDKDDNKIVLCDGCDEAYHTYCMKPPRVHVPNGKWYCLNCNVAKAKEGMRKYEERILRIHQKKEVVEEIADGRDKEVVKESEDDTNQPMDVLLSAVEKLSSEEDVVAETDVLLSVVEKLSSEEDAAAEMEK